MAAADDRVKVVTLSRNFGHQAALTAGARARERRRRGDDRRRPPGPAGADPGDGRPLARGRGRRLRRAAARARGRRRSSARPRSWFYRLFGRLADIDLTPDSGDFRLMDRRALDALLAMPERSRFLRGMTVWVGFNQTAVTFRARGRARPGGRSSRCARCCASASTRSRSFSNRPLQFATLLGFACSALAFLAIPLTVVARYTNIYDRGIPSLIVAILLLGGIQLICVGIIGEYVGRIYDEVKRRPLYVVRDRTNLDEVRIAVIGAGVAGLRRRLPAHRRRPRGRRVRALAGARRPGRDDRHRRRPPAGALLPPPVHHRPPHRRAVRRARDAGRARVAAVERRDVRARPPVAVHDARRPAAVRPAAAVRPRADGRRGAAPCSGSRTTRRDTSG